MKITKSMLKEMISEKMEGEVNKEMASHIATIFLNDEHFLGVLKKGEVSAEALIKDISQDYLQVRMEELKKELFNQAQIDFVKQLLEKKLNG